MIDVLGPAAGSLSETPRRTLIAGNANDTRLAGQVRPESWVNPTPTGRYHLVVIGAGTAGLVTAAAAAGLGARVALVERHLMGGDCLNVGCVPSKALLRSARAWHDAKVSAVSFAGPVVTGDGDFAAVMESMRSIRADLSAVDSASRFRGLGVDVYFGEAAFASREQITVGQQSLAFRRAVIATGARARVPDIPGLVEAGFYTNETIFSLQQRPGHLIIVGGGPVGCELAQAFARLNTKVTLVVREERVLVRAAPGASRIVHNTLVRDGVAVMLQAKTTEVTRHLENTTLNVRTPAGEVRVTGDVLLIAAGRAPNIEQLELGNAGVGTDASRGVIVNDRLQTSNPRVYAIGDVSSALRLTHAADFQARMVVQNALFFGRRKASNLITPQVTYTDPEVAQVGMTQEAAGAAGVAVDVVHVPMDEVDRARLERSDYGFCEFILARGTDRILGASITSAHAGEHISAVVLAMQNKLGLSAFGATMHPYPTHGEMLRKAADSWRRRKLTPRVKAWFARYFRLFS
ncbi:MAG: FAD-containing oxidoreductase [Phycisphaerae bacterium]|nr:FAD-containing oxidoreductase [Gemmatimonadaceae bacterium]